MEWHIHLLHPKLVHFPIALFMSALGLEILSLLFRKDALHRTAVHIYVLAAFISPVVVLTGLQEVWHEHLHHPVLDIHQRFGLLTMFGSLATLPILWVLQKRNSKLFRAVFAASVIMIFIFVTVTAYNGGRMVYEYGVGVGDHDEH